jgi:hypothetical protein
MHHLPLLLLVVLAGCVSGPSYAGGPTTDQPYAIVNPNSPHIYTWKVDGRTVDTRTGEIYVAPGRREILIRVSHPIDSDERTYEPYDWKTIPLHAKAGMVYLLDRKPGDFAPYEVDIRQFKIQ